MQLMLASCVNILPVHKQNFVESTDLKFVYTGPVFDHETYIFDNFSRSAAKTKNANFLRNYVMLCEGRGGVNQIF